MLIIFAGLPGVGKSTISQRLAAELRAVYFRVDTVEQSLIDYGVADIGGMGYSAGYAIARDNIRLGRIVVADTVNPILVTRNAWRRAALDLDKPYVDVEVYCSDLAEHRRRVEERILDCPRRANLTWEDVITRE